MDKGLLSQRYAQALYEFAHTHGQDKEIQKAMRQLLLTWNEMPSFRKALLIPTLSYKEKLQLLEQAVPSERESGLVRFYQLLLRRNRLPFLGRIAQAYLELWNQQHGVVETTLQVVHPVSVHLQTLLKRAILKAVSGHKVVLSQQMNESLIGGFILQVDSLQVDASVVGELAYIRNSLS